jgi:hypothetical protein
MSDGCPPSPAQGKELLTEDERKVLEALAEAWRRFLALPVQHKWDQTEFMLAIHQAQYVVLARPVIRTRKDVRDIGRN